MGPGSIDWIQQLTRGRQGGVIQLARKVLKNECDTVLFFQDAETPREHDMEIQVLDRAAQMADSHCLLLYDEQSAARWADNVSVCLDAEQATGATTLVEAYRRVFGVELVLAEPDPGYPTPDDESSDKTIWRHITRTAATHVVGALRAARVRRAERGEPVRFGIPWGGAVHDVLGAVDEDWEGIADGDEGEPERVLSGAIGLQDFVDENEDGKGLHYERQYAVRAKQWPPAPKAPQPYGADELRVIPTVGVIGARDRSLESHSLVERAVKILGGGKVTYPESAFALKKNARDNPLGETPDEDWRKLDVLLLSAAPMASRPDSNGAALATALPADLAESYADCLGAIGTIYLEQGDNDVAQRQHHSYEQVGIKLEQIRKLRKNGEAKVVLVNGAEKNEDRRRACWAALKAKVATTFVTDKDFAWEVLEEEIPELSRPGRGR